MIPIGRDDLERAMREILERLQEIERKLDELKPESRKVVRK